MISDHQILVTLHDIVRGYRTSQSNRGNLRVSFVRATSLVVLPTKTVRAFLVLAAEVHGPEVTDADIQHVRELLTFICMRRLRALDPDCRITFYIDFTVQGFVCPSLKPFI